MSDANDAMIESLIGNSAGRAVHLALFRAGYDPRDPEDMRKLSDDLRNLREGRATAVNRHRQVGAGAWTALFMLLAFAVTGLISFVSALPIWGWMHVGGPKP
jgi:hypothetical protein